MAKVNEAKAKAFKTAKSLNTWLSKNHNKKEELWVKVYKKASGIKSVIWQEIVMETLCWGWIDGVKKSLGDDAYLQRITPRKPNSAWSKKNTQNIELLIKENRMETPGLEQVNAAKKDGRWENAYAPASELKVPNDFLNAVENNAKIKAFYESLTKTNYYAIAYGLTTAKKSKTRKRRFDKFMGMLERGEKPDFGFKKKAL
ncbi:YdeI family protein [Marinicella sp. W31]|uniref:YdeI/OmpD-associated family protein n=1 Tax=Marinicella sp. W31 TaxID=3023713 RepID=UPI0037574DF5